jgi:hypothetical protein
LEVTWGAGNGGRETVNDGAPTPWNTSHDGYRLELVREADFTATEFAYTLPIGEQTWLAPVNFKPREIEVVANAQLVGPAGLEVSLEQALAVWCKPATFMYIWRPATKVTKIGPGGVTRLEVRGRVICPRDFETCTDPALVVGWYPTPGGPAVTVESLGCAVVAFRNVGFGSTTA